MTDKCKQVRKRKRKLTKSPYFNTEDHTIITSKKESNNVIISHVDSQDSDFKTEKLCSYFPKITRLPYSFFNIPCVELAKALLGKVLVRQILNGRILKGRIVETESYLGGDDKASISYGGKITEKSKPMYMKPGTTFVYLTYGMYNLINISSYGEGAAVLIRALDPVEGMEQMAVNRNEFQPNKNKPKKKTKEIPSHQLCSGPAKLCISLNITKDKCNMQDLTCWSEMWVEPGEDVPETQIVKSRRIGIDSAGPEWANKLLRFYVINNKSVSKRDKVQEQLLLSGKL